MLPSVDRMLPIVSPLALLRCYLFKTCEVGELPMQVLNRAKLKIKFCWTHIWSPKRPDSSNHYLAQMRLETSSFLENYLTEQRLAFFQKLVASLLFNTTFLFLFLLLLFLLLLLPKNSAFKNQVH